MNEERQLPAPLVDADIDLRTIAAEKGLARYSDGRPCIHGHVGERYTRNAYCVTCQRLATTAARIRIRELMRAGR